MTPEDRAEMLATVGYALRLTSSPLNTSAVARAAPVLLGMITKEEPIYPAARAVLESIAQTSPY